MSFFFFFVRHFQNANQFDPDVVLNQLRYSGMLETVKIRRAGFPVRRTFNDFYSRSVSQGRPCFLCCCVPLNVCGCAIFTGTRSSGRTKSTQGMRSSAAQNFSHCRTKAKRSGIWGRQRWSTHADASSRTHAQTCLCHWVVTCA